MDPHHQRGFLVSGQEPPEMNPLPTDKDFNLGLLGTPTLTNQFYPGSQGVDPVNDVNNLPVPERSYHQTETFVHDKLITGDVIISRAVIGSKTAKTDDQLIRLSQEQNGNDRDSRGWSPGLLDIQFPMSPGISPDDSKTMDYGTFDPGPDQGRSHRIVQFSESNGSNSNFGSPASDGQHPIEDDQAMETEDEARFDGYDHILAADSERHAYASARNQLGTQQDLMSRSSGSPIYQTDVDFDASDSNGIHQGAVEHSFRADPNVTEDGDLLHVEPILATTGQTDDFARNMANYGSSPVVGAQEHSQFCQPQMELHQRAGNQQYEYMRNGAPAFRQSYHSYNMIQDRAMEHTFRADPDVTGQEDQLHLEPILETTGQTYNYATNLTNKDDHFAVDAPDQQMRCLPGNLASVLPNCGRNCRIPAEEIQNQSVFCQPQMEFNQQVGKQQYDGMRSGAPALRQSSTSIVQDQAVRHTGHEGQLHVEQPYATSGQTYNVANNRDAVWAPDQRMRCLPGNLAEIHPHNDAPRDLSAQDYSEHPYTTAGDFCKRRMEMQRQAERQQQAEQQHRHGGRQAEQSEPRRLFSYGQGDYYPTSNETHQPIGNHFYREQGNPQTGHEPIRPLSNGHGDYYPDPRRFTSSGSTWQQNYTGNLNQERFPRQEVPNGMNLRYRDVESGSYQINSGDVEAADNITGGPGNCHPEFGRITRITASLSDHTDDIWLSSEESGIYSLATTPDQTTTDVSPNGLLPPNVTNEEHPLNQLFLPNFTVKSKDDEAFQQLQLDLLMDYSDEELEGMGNNGFLLIDNNDIGMDVDRLCETYKHYATRMDNWQPLEILTDEDMEYFSLTGILMENDNNEGFTSNSSSSTSVSPAKKRRNSYKKTTLEQRDIRKKETNRKASANNLAKKKSARDTAQKILKYIRSEVKIQQAAITEVEENAAFANELLELTAQSDSYLRDTLQQEAQFHNYCKGEKSQVLDNRREGDRNVLDALQKKQSAREELDKATAEYHSTDDKKKKQTIGSQKTRALQKYELMKSQYDILVDRHDLRREKFLKGLADLYFRRTVSRYINRIWIIPVEVIQLLSQQQRMLQLDKLQKFLRDHRYLLMVPF